MKILNKYVEDNMNVLEYTKDGKTVSHIVKTPIPVEIIPTAPQPTVEDKINYLYYKATGVIA